MIPVRYSVRNLGQRMTSSAMTALSVALVVMVLTILLGFIDGMRGTMTRAAGPGNYIVLQRGVADETGYINHQSYQIVRFLAGIAADKAGNPLLSPEAIVGFDPTPDSPRASTATIRLVTPMAYEVHPGIRIVEGHRPERLRNEWMVGQRLAAQYPNLHVGAKFRWGPLKTDFLIAGIFSDDGSARESEVWADIDDLAAIIHLAPADIGYNSLHVVLKPGYADAFAKALHGDTRLRVDLMSERAFYQQAAGFSNQIRQLGLVVAIILAIGAIFGAMNTMYSAVARRRHEVGTLRVLGFASSSVLGAFVLESAVLGLIGGFIGELLAIVVAHATGLESRVMSVGNILFSFRLPWIAFGYGLVAAIVIGVAGGLLPAWQASRLRVTEALRE
jgi:putative ABC transport system permease protein